MNSQTIDTENYYTPGVCNINKPESAYRRKVGFIFLGITVALIGLAIAFEAGLFVAIGVFIASFLSAISFLQARNNFCVAYASSGKYNSSDDYAKVAAVTDEQSRKKDKQKSQKMHAQAAVIAAVIALAVVFIA